MSRIRIMGIGAVLMALLAVGAVTGRNVFAQDATPSATAGDSAAEQADYQNFVAKLAANLGITDATTVDTAIKTTLTQMVDEELAAGTITADEATAAKTAIANGQVGDLLDVDHVAGGKHGHGGSHDGDQGGKNSNDNDSDDGANGTPTASTSA